ncbi:MAG: intradiol ring-cleavage dioxygenase [Planctomycetaceae bacterium]|nr:intradiol ring-cleavage dioxygenase [Planctomycetaceae bacterium]
MPFIKTRRDLLKLVPAGASLMLTPGLFAEMLEPTARLTEGPFYPDHLPLDTDNDLLILNDSITPAVGEITHLSGQVLSASGSPIRNAFVEIWQVDNNGAYLHTQSGNAEKRDNNFQGYGRFLTNQNGEYYFRTIKPVSYPGRTPHIHIAVSLNGQRALTTQILITGHPQNDSDGVFRTVREPKQRETLLASFDPIPNSPLNELSAKFQLVLGQTVDENQLKEIHGGIAKPERMGRPPGPPRRRP